MKSHNTIYCAETNYLQGNSQKVLSTETYGAYGNWLYTTTYCSDDKPHNHDSISTESNVSVHIAVYFYIRVD